MVHYFGSSTFGSQMFDGVTVEAPSITIIYDKPIGKQNLISVIMLPGAISANNDINLPNGLPRIKRITAATIISVSSSRITNIDLQVRSYVENEEYAGTTYNIYIINTNIIRVGININTKQLLIITYQYV